MIRIKKKIFIRPGRGQLNPMSFSRVERPLKASVCPIPLGREFPCLVGHREGTLSRDEQQQLTTTTF
jgi:hypothetical protein